MAESNNGKGRQSDDDADDGGVDLRGGFGVRQPNVVYNTADPLFEFNVLVTGIHARFDEISARLDGISASSIRITPNC